MHEIERHTPSRLDDARRDEMKTPEDVTAMARLKSLGWGGEADRCGAWLFEEHGEALADPQHHAVGAPRACGGTRSPR